MNLLKFIEIQNKDTFIHRLPIPLKIIPTIIILLINYIAWLKQYSTFIYAVFIVSSSLIIAVYFREPAYVKDIFVAYILLWFFLAVLYAPVINPFIFLTRYLNWFLFLLAIGFSLIIFLASTSVSQLETFLYKLHLPRSVIKVLTITYNIMPSIYNEIQQIIVAQKARGLVLSKNPIKRAIQMVAVLMPLLSLILIRSEFLEQAIKARGG